MNFNEYQRRAVGKKFYHKSIDNFIRTLEIPKEENREKLKDLLGLLYNVIGLSGEVGEVCEKVKKSIRDNDCEISDVEALSKELGDVQWYVAAAADELCIPLDSIASDNLAKLESRERRNKLGGSGDER